MQLSITAKVFLAFMAVVATFAGASAHSVYQMDRLQKNVQVIHQGHIQILLALTEAGGDLKLFDAVLEERDPIVLERTLTVARQLYPFPVDVRRHVARALKVTGTSMRGPAVEEDQALFKALAAELIELRRGLDELDSGAAALLMAVEEGGLSRVTEVQQELKHRSKSLQVRVRRLTATLRESLGRSVERAESDERQTVWAVLLLTCVAMLITLGVTVVAGWALRPVGRLTEAVKAVAAGGEVRRVEVQTSDEVGILATEFNRMVASLEQRDRALRVTERLATVGRMAAQVAHEVRNPLMSIGLNVELLEEELATPTDSSPEEARSILQGIQREVERLTGVTESYLALARLPRPELDLGGVNGVVEDLLSFLGEELSRRQVEVKLALAPELPVIRMDRNQLRQGLLNLVRNGMEAMASGGALSLTTAPATGGVELTISDTGPGIDAKDLERIFDPLFSTKPGGTGLGLAVTRQIVRGHGGEINYEQQVDAGATFRIYLPGDEPSSTTGPPAPGEPS